MGCSYCGLDDHPRERCPKELADSLSTGGSSGRGNRRGKRGSLSTKFLPNAVGAALFIGGVVWAVDAFSPENLHGNGGSLNVSPKRTFQEHSFTIYQKPGDYQLFVNTGMTTDKVERSLADCLSAKDADDYCSLIYTADVRSEKSQCWAASVSTPNYQSVRMNLTVIFDTTEKKALSTLLERCEDKERYGCIGEPQTGCAPASP